MTYKKNCTLSFLTIQRGSTVFSEQYTQKAFFLFKIQFIISLLHIDNILPEVLSVL